MLLVCNPGKFLCVIPYNPKEFFSLDKKVQNGIKNFFDRNNIMLSPASNGKMMSEIWKIKN